MYRRYVIFIEAIRMPFANIPGNFTIKNAAISSRVPFAPNAKFSRKNSSDPRCKKRFVSFRLRTSETAIFQMSLFVISPQ